MNKMKKTMSALLVLVLILSLGACSGSKGTGIHGTWAAVVDGTEAAGLNGVFPDFNTPLEMTIVYTIKEDGTYTASLDKDATRASISNFMKALAPYMVDSMIQGAADEGGLTEQEARDYIQDTFGQSIEEYVDAMIETQMDSDTLVDALNPEESGTFKVDGNQFITTFKDPSGTESTEIVEFSLSGDTLEFLKLVEPATSESAALFPMTFHRK